MIGLDQHIVSGQRCRVYAIEEGVLVGEKVGLLEVFHRRQG